MSLQLLLVVNVSFTIIRVNHVFSCPHRPPHSIETLSAAAEKASGIPAYLPNCLLLKDTIRKAREWLQEAEELQVSSHFIDAHYLYTGLIPLVTQMQLFLFFFPGQRLHHDD